VEAPNQGPELALAYSAPCTVDTPLAQVASGFLTTLLTGTGDLSRYTTLDAGIVALRPAPYTTLDTVTVTSDNAGCGTSGSAARVLATVNPKGDGGAAATLAYPLTMVRNGGQWQVQTVDSIPALSNPLAVIANQDSHSIGPSSGPSTTTSAPSTSVRIPPATQK
jgi:hypothetical protein